MVGNHCFTLLNCRRQSNSLQFDISNRLVHLLAHSFQLLCVDNAAWFSGMPLVEACPTEVTHAWYQPQGIASAAASGNHTHSSVVPSLWSRLTCSSLLLSLIHCDTSQRFKPQRFKQLISNWLTLSRVHSQSKQELRLFILFGGLLCFWLRVGVMFFNTHWSIIQLVFGSSGHAAVPFCAAV